jgi:hypothetical protein
MTAGYSGTPLAKKLGIKEGSTVVVANPPEDYLELISPLPRGVTVTEKTGSGADIFHIFTNGFDELAGLLSDARGLISQDGAIWVSWYKKAAKLPTEITEDRVREAAFPLGLVDVKVCAVDDRWSGLKLVIRRENRVRDRMNFP